MNKDKHKLYMAQILGLIFRDKDLCRLLAFKGGQPRAGLTWNGER